MHTSRGRESIDNVYQYALSSVGFFIDSPPLWHKYNDYLKSIEQEGMDRNTKGGIIAKRRKFYQHAVVIPTYGKLKHWNDSFDVLNCIRLLYILLID